MFRGNGEGDGRATVHRRPLLSSRHVSLRHMAADDIWGRLFALGNTARVGRILTLTVVSSTALVAGWGNSALIALVLAGGIVASVGYSRLSRHERASDRLEGIAAVGWTAVLVAFAFASLDATRSVYYEGPLALVSLATVTSFVGTLRPRLAMAWLVATAAVVLIAQGVATHGVTADAVLTSLAMLVVGAMAVATNLKREDAELDRRDLTDLARRLDPTAAVATMAAQVAESIAGWGMFDTVAVVAFEGTRSATVLAKSVDGADAIPHEVGELLHADRVAYLLERAERGPWIERTRSNLVVRGGRAQRIDSEHPLAYAPILAEDVVVGLIVTAARSRGHTGLTMLADELPVLVDAAALAATALGPALARKEAEVERREAIARTIAQRLFHPVYQPVLDLPSGCVVGFEALTRFDDGTPPNRVFDQAERLGLGLALEEATLCEAIRNADELPEAAWLSLNLSPAFLLSGRATPILFGSARSFVIELTEHVAISDYRAIRAALDLLGPTVRLAVDDAGAGFASLRHVIELEPQIVKLDLALVRGIDADPSRQALLSSLCHFAAKTDCRLLAEGIETDAELSTIRALGINLGQGYLLGRPGLSSVVAGTRPIPIESARAADDAA